MMYAMTSPVQNAWWRAPGTSPWVLELLDVRRVGVDGVGGLRRNQLPLLKKLATRAYPLATLTRDAIRSLLQDVVDTLPVPLAEAAQYEFGLRRVPGQQTPGMRRERAAEVLGVKVSAFRHAPGRERELLEQVAELLASWVGSTKPMSVQRSAGNYVKRRALHIALDEAIARSHGSAADQWPRRGMVAVRGEVGSGSSRLASEYFASNTTIRLRASSEVSLLADMCRLLEHMGKSIGADKALVRHAFGRFLSSTDGPRTVIFDDVLDLSELVAWLPERLRKTVVVVTRQVVDSGLCPVVTVGPITDDDELIQFVRIDNPDLSSDDAYRLGVAVGRRARAIVAIGTLLRSLDGVAPEDLARAVESDVIRGLEAATPDGAHPITSVYRMAIGNLQQHHRNDSLELLTLMCLGDCVNVTARPLSAFLNQDINIGATIEGRLRFAAAVRPLVELSLVQSERGRYSVDPLTARLLRALIASPQSVMACVNAVLCAASFDENSMLSPIDLLDAAWSAEDVANFSSMSATVLLRVDPDASLPAYSGTGLRKLSPHDDITITDRASQLSEQLYALVRTFLGDGDMRDASYAAFRSMPRKPLEVQLREWVYWPDLIGVFSVDVMEAAAIVSAPPANSDLDRWLAALDLPLPVSAHRREQWRDAYTLFKLIEIFARDTDRAWQHHLNQMYGNYMLPFIEDLNDPEERDIAEICFDLVRLTQVLNRRPSDGFP